MLVARMNERWCWIAVGTLDAAGAGRTVELLSRTCALPHTNNYKRDFDAITISQSQSQSHNVITITITQQTTAQQRVSFHAPL
jgi:hypothetical protein